MGVVYVVLLRCYRVYRYVRYLTIGWTWRTHNRYILKVEGLESLHQKRSGISTSSGAPLSALSPARHSRASAFPRLRRRGPHRIYSEARREPAHACNTTALFLQCDGVTLTQPNTRWKVSEYKEKQIVYAQGDPANSIFYVHTGQVKVTVISNLGKEAIVSNPRTTRILRRRSNEWCAAAFGFSHYNAPCEIIRLETQTIVRLLRANQEFADYFLTHLLTPDRPGRSQTRWTGLFSITARCG